MTEDITCKRCEGSGIDPNRMGYDGEEVKDPCLDCDGTGIMEMKDEI